MSTKRPDQLPSGSNFGMQDIVIVEKNPDSSSKSLEKATISDFMGSALKFDPKRIGQNAITGSQSQIEWLISGMNTLAASNTNSLSNYSSYSQSNPGAEAPYVTPTPSITTTPTITPTVSVSATPNASPPPTPTITPTPSTSRPSSTKQITFSGPMPKFVIMPPEHRPEAYGFTSFSLFNNTSTTGNISEDFDGFLPDSFNPSQLGETLLQFEKFPGQDNLLIVATFLIDELNDIYDVQGLINSSSLTFTVSYS